MDHPAQEFAPDPNFIKVRRSTLPFFVKKVEDTNWIYEIYKVEHIAKASENNRAWVQRTDDRIKCLYQFRNPVTKETSQFMAKFVDFRRQYDYLVTEHNSDSKNGRREG